MQPGSAHGFLGTHHLQTRGRRAACHRPRSPGAPPLGDACSRAEMFRPAAPPLQLAPCLTSRLSAGASLPITIWLPGADSNRRPAGYEPAELPSAPPGHETDRPADARTRPRIIVATHTGRPSRAFPGTVHHVPYQSRIEPRATTSALTKMKKARSLAARTCQTMQQHSHWLRWLLPGASAGVRDVPFRRSATCYLIGSDHIGSS